MRGLKELLSNNKWHAFGNILFEMDVAVNYCLMSKNPQTHLRFFSDTQTHTYTNHKNHNFTYTKVTKRVLNTHVVVLIHVLQVFNSQ